MSITDKIEIVGICVSIIVGVFSFIYSHKSNKIAKEANELSKQSNVISNKSLKISEEIKNDQNEHIIIKNYNNLQIMENKNIKFIGNKCYEDYLLLIPIEINNVSSNPVSVKRPYFLEGNNGEYIYVADEELYSLEGYKQDYHFPIYLSSKESKYIDIIIGLSSAERMKFYSEKGITLNFTCTKNTYKKYFNSNNVIDNSSK